MNTAWIFISICIVSSAVAFPAQEAKPTTEEKPDQEFVFVQSSGSKAKPITRKDKTVDKERPFETAHKLPPSLTYALNDEEEETTSLVKLIKKSGKKVHKRAAQNAPAPAPAGAIKLNVAKLLEKYKQEIKTSTTEKPSSTAKTTKASRRRIANKRTKKEIKAEDSGISATSPSPVLTTSKIAPKNIDMDVVGAASEKQRSRIQIKKGPNGQEYEYEYVYYYYDEDDEKDKITNAHDGPAKNTISRSDKNREKPTPEANEVVPSRGKARGRQLGEDEPVQEERLPANTRFPPRSRNLNTTPVPDEDDDSKVAASRTRTRGKATTESSNAEDDNVSDETQGTRGRTRANVRRPSLDLVDSETFNTHSAAAQSPSFPAQLPAGPEDPEDKEPSREPAPVSENTEETKKPVPENGEPTTPMAGMEKVALDLYAISQGTQKLFGEDGTEISTEDGKSTGETDATTPESSSTEEIETTTPTTTTTTTTTTPAPTTTTRTTTTTTEAPTKASRFGGRRTPLSGRKGGSTTTTEASSPSEKPKKFGRPSGSFGGRRNKPTHAPAVEEDSHKEESKPVSQSKPATRGRFGGPRTRGRTTAAPEERKDDSSTSAPTTNHKPTLPRSRPSFNSLKGRGRTTTSAPASEEAPADSEPQGSSSEPVSTTTARARRVLPGATGNIKPLRPGPRINLAGRRGGQTTTTTTEASAAENNSEAENEEETHVEAASEKDEAPAPAPVDNSPLGRLRNKQNRVNVQPKSKSTPTASASAQVQVRRVNPLLARRRPGATTEAPSSEAPSSEAPEEAEEAEIETEAAPSSSTTTEEPKGLSKLLAGRRRAGARVPGTISHK
ncbi:flocculation protein FLO11 isoform X2 [Sitophilus oryzae]|uniref:Flocculation protein FLO11 isoform X2 n=1 Tax=Sitophilus oryzae TaxID=7048 RepID=A0A6J2YDD3_SITOR|nr:flocculation protein FLO11 isoform X2 [Sitophilus oryzae]